MYSRDQVKTYVEKIINMAKADAVEVTLTGGERSGTRWANSSITVNLVQYDRNVNVTVRSRTESRQRDDARLQRCWTEGDGRRSGRGSERGAGHAEPARAHGRAGVPPCRRRAAADGELRSGRARADGQDQHRHQREAGHASAPATFRRTIRRPATRTRKDCSRTTASPKRASSSRAAWRTAAAPVGQASPASKIRVSSTRRADQRDRVEQGAAQPQGAERSSRDGTP